jgi:hypothetical protein
MVLLHMQCVLLLVLLLHVLCMLLLVLPMARVVVVVCRLLLLLLQVGREVGAHLVNQRLNNLQDDL